MDDPDFNLIMEIEVEEEECYSSSSVSDCSNEDDGEVGDLARESDVWAAADEASTVFIIYSFIIYSVFFKKQGRPIQLKTALQWRPAVHNMKI